MREYAKMFKHKNTEQKELYITIIIYSSKKRTVNDKQQGMLLNIVISDFCEKGNNNS
ncbi:hypothetical protein DSECCO2_659130 [anaerobic digester metagenome]